MTAVVFDAGIDDGLRIKYPYRKRHEHRQTWKQQKLLHPFYVQWTNPHPVIQNHQQEDRRVYGDRVEGQAAFAAIPRP